MHDLIKIQPRDFSGAAVQTVNARDLHAFLEISSAFKDWIARRISDYGFEDGCDFCSFLSESSGGRPAKEYAISLSMAKELAMVERNDKGKQARLYFIECERQAKQATAVALPDFTDPAAAARAWAEQFEQRKALEAQNAQQAQVLAVAMPKAVVFDDLHSRPGCMCIRDAAKNIGVGERELIRKLLEKKWLYRREGADGKTGGLKASTYGLEKGYFEHYPRPGRDGELRDALLVTTKGLHRLTYNAFQVWGLQKRRA